ncbi:unnamed protein product [Pylaiella littoralis]
MSRSRADFEGGLFDEASPASKRQRLFSGSNGSGIGDGDGCSHTSYGRPHEDGGGSTFAINNYEDSDFDDDDDDDPAGDATASPAGVAGGGGGGGGGLARKNKKKPWKLHGRSGGGRGRGRSMHDANLYRHYRPDFRELAREYPETFGPHVRDDPDTGRATIDWTDPAAMRELTRVMLRHDFGLLEWDAPLDRLCPPVANRLNYICWLSDLMKLSSSSSSSSSSSPFSPSSSSPPRSSQQASTTTATAMSAGKENPAASASGGGGDGVAEGGGGGTATTTTTTNPAAMSMAQRNLLLFGTAGGLGGEEEEEGGGSEDMAVCDDDIDDGDDKGRRQKSGAVAVAAPAPAPPVPKKCRGIDIGTGASCIYPLLGAKVAGWSFLATEIDAVSAEWAEKNVRSNGLQGQVSVRLVHPLSGDGGDGEDDAAPGPLLTTLGEEDGDFDFSMTNPPFFESADEAGQNPDTATGEMAAEGEVACPGGEVAFVRAIIRDSLRLKQRVRWYTTMVGKKSNAKKLLRVLREAGVRNTRTTEFFQGRTVRWGLAWSFTSEGMVGDKVPDDPSVKVFSKKKAADRTQHNFRSFSVPLRPRPPASSVETPRETTAGGIPGDGTGDEGGGGSGGGAIVKITVPANLPLDAGDVVERLKSSMMAFKQADVKVEAVDEDDYGGGGGSSISATSERRFRCEARTRTGAGGSGKTTRITAPAPAAPPAARACCCCRCCTVRVRAGGSLRGGVGGRRGGSGRSPGVCTARGGRRQRRLSAAVGSAADGRAPAKQALEERDDARGRRRRKRR